MPSLPRDYFDNYADDIDDGDRSYSSNWREYGFHRFQDYLEALKSKYMPVPKTLLEIGSADGSVIRELAKIGIEARGIEYSREIFDTAGIERRKIACGDAVQIIKAIPDNSYDCIYETSAQYIEKKYLRKFFKSVHRVTKKDLVIVLHTYEDDPKPHKYQVNHERASFWIDLLEETGFKNMSKQATPFWFRKEL